MSAQHIMEKRDKFGLVGWESSKRRSVKLRLMSSKMTGSGTKLKRSLSLSGTKDSWELVDRSGSKVNL